MAKKKDIEKKQKAVQTPTPVETKSETTEKKAVETAEEKTETAKEHETEVVETDAVKEKSEDKEAETEATESETAEEKVETIESEKDTEEKEEVSEATEKEASEKEEVEKEPKTEEVKSEEVEKETAEVEKESSDEKSETSDEDKESETEKSDEKSDKVEKETTDKESESESTKVEAIDKKSETTEAKKKSKFILYDIVWVIIGLVAGILISFCIFNLSMKSAIEDIVSKTQTNTVKSASDISKITTYSDPSTIITDADKIKKVQKSVEDYASGLKKGSTYSQVMTGQDQYVYYLYNTNGEVFTQDTAGSYTELFLKDGKVFKYDNNEQSLSVGSDIDLASLLVNGIDAVGNDNITLYEMKHDSDDTEKANGHEYRVDLKGEDAVKLLYKSAGDEFATSMVDSIKSSISDWEPHIIMVYFIGDTVDESYCYCLYVIDNQEYTNWFLQGYDTTNDWSLDNAWYSYDSSKDTDGKQYTELATKLVGDINTVMNDYANSKGWLTNNDNQSTESTEVATESKETKKDK